MMQKRLRRLVIGGVVPAALAVGSVPSAGAGTGNGGSSSPAANLQVGHPAAKTSAPALAGVRGGSVGAENRLCETATRELCLTDHEQYVRHHQRLATPASSRS